MAEIQVAEAKSPKRSPKVLSHLELHPKLGGGYLVRHMYTGYQHEPRSVEFNKSGIAKGGETIHAHIQKHAGLPQYSNKDGSATEERIDA